jgi:hypothetical protein
MLIFMGREKISLSPKIDFYRVVYYYKKRVVYLMVYNILCYFYYGSKFDSSI